MIKKTGALFLTLLYIVAAMGFVLNFHYPDNGLKPVIAKVAAPAKTAKMMACKTRCCREKHSEIKPKEVHQAQLSTYFDKLFAFQLPVLPSAGFFTINF